MADARLTRAEQREQTRSRLLDAAQDVFAEVGIGAAAIEEIAERAGYSRGAFYSNFRDKHDLVRAVLEDRAERSATEVRALLDATADPAEFFAHLRRRELDQRGDAVFLELALYAMRNPEARPAMAAIMQASRDHMRHIVESLWAREGFDAPPFDSEVIVKILEALDDGFTVLRLIEPDEYPLGIYSDSVVLLQQAGVALARELQR